LTGLSNDAAKLEELGIDQTALKDFLATDPAGWNQSSLDAIGLTDPVLYSLFGDSIYDTSKKLHNRQPSGAHRITADSAF
jgi:hypothetical protein